jgi:hypothetical protein
MTDDFTHIDVAAGGHATLALLNGGMVSLQTAGPSGRPGAIAMTTDEVRALIAALVEVTK